MDALTQLDALCVTTMVADHPVTFGFNGVDYVGTHGHRDTGETLEMGGFLQEQEFRLLVSTAQFEGGSRPAERDKITLCVDADLIPCSVDDAVGARVGARITEIGRAMGGLTYTIRTDKR